MFLFTCTCSLLINFVMFLKFQTKVVLLLSCFVRESVKVIQSVCSMCLDRPCSMPSIVSRSLATMAAVWKAAENTSTFTNRQIIREQIIWNSKISSRKIAWENGIKCELARQMVKRELGFNLYKLQKAQLLTDDNVRSRDVAHSSVEPLVGDKILSFSQTRETTSTAETSQQHFGDAD